MLKTLFVRNLAWAATDDDLHEAFETKASVANARVAFDKETGKTRGYGFVDVEIADQTALEALIAQTDGMEICGRPVNVMESRKPPRSRQ